MKRYELRSFLIISTLYYAMFSLSRNRDYYELFASGYYKYYRIGDFVPVVALLLGLAL